MKELLKVNGLKKGTILRNIGFEVREGEMTAIMGPSGSGNPRFCTMCPEWTGRTREKCISGGRRSQVSAKTQRLI